MGRLRFAHRAIAACTAIRWRSFGDSFSFLMALRATAAGLRVSGRSVGCSGCLLIREGYSIFLSGASRILLTGADAGGRIAMVERTSPRR